MGKPMIKIANVAGPVTNDEFNPLAFNTWSDAAREAALEARRAGAGAGGTATEASQRAQAATATAVASGSSTDHAAASAAHARAAAYQRQEGNNALADKHNSMAEHHSKATSGAGDSAKADQPSSEDEIRAKYRALKAERDAKAGGKPKDDKDDLVAISKSNRIGGGGGLRKDGYLVDEKGNRI